MSVAKGSLRAVFTVTAVSGAAVVACSVAEPTGFVVVLSSQLPVRHAVVRVETEDGTLAACSTYDVADGTAVTSGRVTWPATLGVQPSDRGARDKSVRVLALAYATSPPSDACSNEEPGGAIVRSEAIVSYVEASVFELPMPFTLACVDVPCETGTTCQAGTCVASRVPKGSLPKFVEGTLASSCFDSSRCTGARSLEPTDAPCRFRSNAPLALNDVAPFVRYTFPSGNLSGAEFLTTTDFKLVGSDTLELEPSLCRFVPSGAITSVEVAEGCAARRDSRSCGIPWTGPTGGSSSDGGRQDATVPDASSDAGTGDATTGDATASDATTGDASSGDGASGDGGSPEGSDDGSATGDAASGADGGTSDGGDAGAGEGGGGPTGLCDSTCCGTCTLTGECVPNPVWAADNTLTFGTFVATESALYATLFESGEPFLYQLPLRVSDVLPTRITNNGLLLEPTVLFKAGEHVAVASFLNGRAVINDFVGTTAGAQYSSGSDNYAPVASGDDDGFYLVRPGIDSLWAVERFEIAGNSMLGDAVHLPFPFTFPETTIRSIASSRMRSVVVVRNAGNEDHVFLVSHVVSSWDRFDNVGPVTDPVTNVAFVGDTVLVERTTSLGIRSRFARLADPGSIAFQVPTTGLGTVVGVAPLPTSGAFPHLVVATSGTPSGSLWFLPVRDGGPGPEEFRPAPPVRSPSRLDTNSRCIFAFDATDTPPTISGYLNPRAP
ncbi:MAG: hypothetical protein U0169_23535 [Polyangiaceae bacterium]